MDHEYKHSYKVFLKNEPPVEKYIKIFGSRRRWKPKRHKVFAEKCSTVEDHRQRRPDLFEASDPLDTNKDANEVEAICNQRKLQNRSFLNSYNEELEASAESISDSEDELVPKKRLKVVEEKIENDRKEIKLLRMTNDELKMQNEQLKNELKDLKQKISSHRCTFESDNLISQIKDVKDDVRNMSQDFKEVKEFLQSFAMNVSKEKANREEGFKEEEIKTEVIDLGGVTIHKMDLNIISQQKKNSIFVKELCTLIWDRETLVQRSVTGKLTPNAVKFGKSPKPPLTPEKLCALKELYKQRLVREDWPEYAIKEELRHVNRYVAEKINDLAKTEARRRNRLLDSASDNGCADRDGIPESSSSPNEKKR